MNSLTCRFAGCLLLVVQAFAATPAAKPVKVFILAGQSNMEGQAVADLDGQDYNEGRGTLRFLLREPTKRARFQHLQDDQGRWTVREDVWVRYQPEDGQLQAGPLTLGFTVYADRHHFGPELQFGHVVGDCLENQVLLIKTAWGGKSLYRDFRPPSSGGSVGPYYTKMVTEIRTALANLKADFPGYGGQGYELAGFVWYQGWNDGCEPQTAVPEYEANLVNLIKDVRRDLNAPRLPFVIGELTGPWVEAPGEWAALRRAQAAAAARPEFAGNVGFVPTHDFVRAPEDSPNPGHGHHEFGNAETYLLVGDALGREMVRLLTRQPDSVGPAVNGIPAQQNLAADLAPGLPGFDAGSAWTGNSSGYLSATNGVLSVLWELSPQGLRGVGLRSEPVNRSLTLTSEVFQIVLKDGTRYRASELRPTQGPAFVRLQPQEIASRLAERIPGRKIELVTSSADGRLGVTWRALVRDGAHYVRQEAEVTALTGDLELREVVWFQQAVPDAATAGTVDGSPVVAGSLFLGCEDPMAVNQIASPGGDVICRLPRRAALRPGETLTSSFVLGVAPAGQMRRAFLAYLERERAHPYRPFLHYNSWYDTAWDPFALNETNCLEAIRLCGERFIQPHGVIMDGMVFDDGWDDPKTLWQFHRGFPNGFTPLAELCRQYGTRLGVWLSPFGGYGEPKAQRLKFGGGQGFETNAAGFSLAGPKYYGAFKQSCVQMIRQFGVNHFKFDGIAAGTYASGGAEYLRDTEAMRRLMLELRQEAPDLFINLTTGSWPSPFWLRYTDSVWRQGGDMGLAGKGPPQQQWLTYRDQEVFRNIVRHGPLYPLNSLMTQGVAYSRRGSAGDPTFTSAGFKDDVRAFFGGGTCLQELYIQPGKLTAEDWKVLAEAAKWSRGNAEVLVDTHWIGGDPGKLEVYGYASWSPRKGIVMLRNPDDQPHAFAFDPGAAFDLPPGAPPKYSLRSPWAEDITKAPLSAEIGKPVKLVLQPFEVVVLDASPVL
jgi:hypothetical protein